MTKNLIDRIRQLCERISSNFVDRELRSKRNSPGACFGIDVIRGESNFAG